MATVVESVPFDEHFVFTKYRFLVNKINRRTKETNIATRKILCVSLNGFLSICFFSHMIIETRLTRRGQMFRRIVSMSVIQGSPRKMLPNNFPYMPPNKAFVGSRASFSSRPSLPYFLALLGLSLPSSHSRRPISFPSTPQPAFLLGHHLDVGHETFVVFPSHTSRRKRRQFGR